MPFKIIDGKPTIEKQVGDEQWYGIDLKKRLDTGVGIDSATVAATGVASDNADVTIAGTTVWAFVTGGVLDGTENSVTFTVTLDDIKPSVEVQTIYFDVSAK